MKYVPPTCIVFVLLFFIGCSSDALYELTIDRGAGPVSYPIVNQQDVDALAAQVLQEINSGVMPLSADGVYPRLTGQSITVGTPAISAPAGVTLTSTTRIASGTFILHAPSTADAFAMSADWQSETGWQSHCSGTQEFVVQETFRQIHSAMVSMLDAHDRTQNVQGK